MKYLILLVLLTMSCTDKTQGHSPREYSPEEFARSLAARTNSPKPIIEEVIEPETLFTNTIVNSEVNTTDPSYTPPEIIKLSYENDLDLMLIDTMFTDWNTWKLEHFQSSSDDGAQQYWATYWDTNTHTFYGVTNYFSPISNIQFEYISNNKKKQQEAVFYPTMKEIFTNTGAPLLYIGSISPLERVYLDPTNRVYYIKQLMPYDTTRYLVSDDTTTNIISTNNNIVSTNNRFLYSGDRFVITNENKLSLYPAYDPNFSNTDKDYDEVTDTFIISTNINTPYIYFTNTEGLEFQNIQPYYDVSFFLK